MTLLAGIGHGIEVGDMDHALLDRALDAMRDADACEGSDRPETQRVKILSNGRTSHLSYCSNVHHPGRAGTRTSPSFAVTCRRCATRSPTAPGGRPDSGTGGERRDAFGHRPPLAARALGELEDEATFARFRAWLDAERCYVFTINGFPYGAFHGRAVKADVYRPDWSEPARLDYTCRLATLLARLDPPDAHGSISTLPARSSRGPRPPREAAIVENLLRAVAHCARLERDTGAHVALALEPEPRCLLETADEAARFVEERLLATVPVQRLAALASLSASAARRALHRHLGVCHDVCHSAVEFEAPRAAFDRYAAAASTSSSCS